MNNKENLPVAQIAAAGTMKLPFLSSALALPPTTPSRKPPDPSELNDFVRQQYEKSNYPNLSRAAKREWRQMVADALNERKFTSQQWSQEDIVQKLSRLKCTLKTPKSAQKARFQPTESHDSPIIPRPEPPAPSSSSS